MTDSDGTSTFNTRNVTGTKLDSVTLWHAAGAPPTAGSNEVPANGLYLNTLTGIVYENTNTKASPTWVARISPINYDSIFGDGSDGDATNPALVGGDIKSYNNLTISANTTWGSSETGIIIVRVKGTLTIDATKVLTISGTEYLYFATPLGGSGGGTGGNGGAPSNSACPVIILAKTVAGTGTIIMTAPAATNGSNGLNNDPEAVGGNGGDGGTGKSIGQTLIKRATGGQGGQLSGIASIGIGGIKSVSNDDYLFNINSLFIELAHGGGGGEGGSGTGSPTGGGSGGGGAASMFARGGNGGAGQTATGTGGSGGGGGGGGAASLILIAETLSAITINVTGGTGGNAVLKNAGAEGGGGGGGSASLLLVGTSDTTSGSVTGGTGGTASGGAGTAGSNGVAQKIFITFSVWKTMIERGF